MFEPLRSCAFCTSDIFTVKVKGVVKVEEKAAALRKAKTVTIRLLNGEEKSAAVKTNLL